MSEKNFFENTYDKVSDFVQPNKIEETASFKDSFNKAIENWIITKDELQNLMKKFEEEKSNLWEETKWQLDNLRKEAVKWMLKNGFDIRDNKDIETLNKFIQDIPDLIIPENIKNKIKNINDFYNKADKSMLEEVRDFSWYDNITLTLWEDWKTIVEMWFFDFNNPFNDNESEIYKNKYSLGWSKK